MSRSDIDGAAPAADEAVLVKRFRGERDGAAFDALYRRNRRMVYGTCLRYLRDREAAEDACHDVFLQAYQQFDSLRGDVFSPWVRRIAINHCLNRQRHAATRRRIEPTLVRDFDQGRADASHAAAAARDDLRIAAELVRGLSPKQRLVFLLRHVEQLAYDGIAEVTGLPFDEVRSALQNARRNFRLGWEREMKGARAGTPGKEADCG